MTNHIVMQKIFKTIEKFESTIVPIKHFRFEDSFEVRCMQETIRANKIQKELRDAEEWYMSEFQYRKNRDSQLGKLNKNKEVEKISKMLNKIRKIEKVKIKNPKTINIIFIFILIVIMYFFLHGVDFNNME